jgi:hypothetical protein
MGSIREFLIITPENEQHPEKKFFHAVVRQGVGKCSYLGAG